MNNTNKTFFNAARIILMLILVLFIGISTNAQENKGISFDHGTWAEIKAKAKKENKNIFMDCYTVWCGPCKKLSSQIFPLKAVGEVFNPNYINYKVDMEKGEGIELRKAYGVTVFPTLLFLDADGKLLHRVVGALPAEKLIEEAKKVPEEAAINNSVASNFENNKSNPDMAKKYLAHLLRGRDAKAEEVAEHYFSIIPKEEYLDKQNFNLLKYSIKSPFSPVIEYLFQNEDKFKQKMNPISVDKLIKGTHENYGFQLAGQVREGSAFNEVQFQKLLALMKERNFENVSEYEKTIRLRVLQFENKWDEYMQQVEPPFTNSNPDTLDFKNYHMKYLNTVAYSCKDEVILKRVLSYFESWYDNTTEFDLYNYRNVWSVKKQVYTTLGLEDELKTVDIQLELYKSILSKLRQSEKKIAESK